MARNGQLQLDLGEIVTEEQLVGAALALGAFDVPTVSVAERALAKEAREVPAALVARWRQLLRAGGDPLGETFCALRSPEERRPSGATYTPRAIIDAMLAWAGASGAAPGRVVDPGTGSGRYMVAAGRALPKARLLGVEVDPLAALCARASLAASGMAERAEVVLQDYRAGLPEFAGATLFVGNPPYVRHHEIPEEWKAWLVDTARAQGCGPASQLAGLHVHFFLATAVAARTGDCGAFVTAAEWLDVNYGRVLRDLLLGKLGASAIHVIEPTAEPFPDAATTAAITCFEVGSRPSSVRLRRVESLHDLGALDGGHRVRRKRLEAAGRWSPLTRPTRRGPEGYVELGELCRVHRGAVTGANKVWIATDDADLPPTVLFPSVTKARELFSAGLTLADAQRLRRVIDLPVDLDVFDAPDRKRVNRFLKRAKALGADKSYVAQNRRAWWSVGLRQPAPILATYMARRPPAFVRNLANARHINIAHGLYPREDLSNSALERLTKFLSTEISLFDGRTYAGGLTKFEPREMERLMVPGPDLLVAS